LQKLINTQPLLTGLNATQISWIETIVPGYFALGFIATAALLILYFN
jgi:hypothetical protein